MEKQEKKESWIKVFRNIEKSWLWEERPFSRGQAWIDLLLLAKFRDGSFINRRGNLVDAKKGMYTEVYLHWPIDGAGAEKK